MAGPRGARRALIDGLRSVWRFRPLEEFLVTITRGRRFGTMVTKLPPNHYQYPRDTNSIAIRDGIRYSLDLSDLVDWYIYFGFWEEARVAFYAKVRAGDTVFDVGANVGDVTLHMAQLVGARGAVHSFEPDPANFRRLRQNASMNQFTNVFLNQNGLGDAPGAFNLSTVDEGNRGMNRILAGPGGSGRAMTSEQDSADCHFDVVATHTSHLYPAEGFRAPDIALGRDLRLKRSNR